RFLNWNIELRRRRNFLSFAVITQVVFWLVALILVIYASSVNLKAQDVLPRASLIFICHLVTFYFCYSILIPRYFEKGNRLMAVAGLIALLVVLTPVRNYIEMHFAANADLLNTRFIIRRRLKASIFFSEIIVAAVV